MSIVITGNPGVGKHTITKKISQKLNFPIIDINILAKESETELDITPLKDNDNGRWYLILSDIINFKSLPNI